MKIHPITAPLLACAALLAPLQFTATSFAQSPGAAGEKAPAFESLFNGTDFEGWQQKGNWVAENGAIFRKEKGGSLMYKTKPIPDDFELRFEWKISENGNSGIYYRPGQYEYQILHNQGHPDGRNPRTSAASLYFCMPPAKDATRPPGEWNQGRIICKGSVIQHWLNGEKVLDFDYKNPKWAEEVELLRVRGGDVAARGAFLSLQDHGDLVWYRSLLLRAIPAEEKLESENIPPAAVPEAMLDKEKKFLESKRAGEREKANK
jgi:hypothetical protein